jgi:cytochrome c peroxidase
VRRAGYGDALRAIYGDGVLDDTERAFKAVLKALEVYEQSYKDFYPYSSKYDAWLAGKAKLTAQERRGLALFNDPAKGNCAECHISAPGADGTPPQFTDYGLIALGVPRNRAIPANADPRYHDLGLCGPMRTDLLGEADYCGLFVTPTLRNVATRSVFFHNGVFHTLREVLEFYVERDTNPAKWYPRDRNGRVEKYDDLPAQYRENVNTDPPFGGHPGDKPALDDDEIADVIAFLKTLTDGYMPSNAERLN